MTTDIDFGGYSWTPIVSFKGGFDGQNHTIINLKLQYSTLQTNSTYSYHLGFFSYLESGANIKNLIIDYNYISIAAPTNDYSIYIGGLVSRINITNASSTSISNITIKNLNVTAAASTTYMIAFGGLCGYCNYSNFDGIYCENINYSITGYADAAMHCGSIVGVLHNGASINNSRSIDCSITARATTTSQITAGGICGWGRYAADCYYLYSNTNIYITEFSSSKQLQVGGIVGCSDQNLYYCYYSGLIQARTSSRYNVYQIFCGGIVGDYYASSRTTGNTISNCMFCGTIDVYVSSPTSAQSYCGGIVGKYEDYSSSATVAYYKYPLTLEYCLSAGSINCTSYANILYINGITDNAGSSVNFNVNYCICVSTVYISAQAVSNSYVSTLVYTTGSIYTTVLDSFGNYELWSGAYTSSLSSSRGACTTEQIKDRNNYSYDTFDTYWLINENINNGYPMLWCFLTSAQVTGFEGNGTEADPYQIKTTEDLQGMQAYYNDYVMIDEYYWKIMNDIDISVDANDLTINWTPIGYEGGVESGFNGHFDGNGKTISGLTITEQYENVGLFGRLSSNATITNLNVSGTINWDQATNVGGVVGLMEDGATLTNCTFTGTITGYLNSGNHAVVGGLAGKYGADAITGVANYDCYVYGTDNYTTFNRYSSTYAVA